LARNKVRAKDLKKQRWAGIVAAILAFGMLLGLFGPNVYHAIFGNNTPVPNQQQTEPQPEDYLAYYSGEVERLETYLDQNEPTIPMLLELAENYRSLVFIQQVFFEDTEAVEQSRQNLASVFSTLVEMDPESTEYRLELINLHQELGKEENLVEAEINDLLELLHEEPNLRVHLSLLNLLGTMGSEEKATEEIEWVHSYLEPRYSEGSTDSEESYYYAVLLGEYLGERDMALSILNEIMMSKNNPPSGKPILRIFLKSGKWPGISLKIPFLPAYSPHRKNARTAGIQMIKPIKTYGTSLISLKLSS